MARGIELEELHGCTDDQSDLQQAEVSARTETRAMPESEVKHVTRRDPFRGEMIPPVWREGIRRLATHSNVACKFSGLGSLADKSKPLTSQVRPFFTHCLECFYPERMLWGSDWPVSPKLQEWVETTAELLGELSDHEQAAIGTGNAGRIYRLN